MWLLLLTAIGFEAVEANQMWLHWLFVPATGPFGEYLERASGQFATFAQSSWEVLVVGGVFLCFWKDAMADKEEV